MKLSLRHRLSSPLLLAAGIALAGRLAAAQTPAPDAVTTLAALRANTTSTADSFPGAFNGLPKGGNLSPLPITSLLPTGEKTRYIAHLVPWFTLRCAVRGPNCGHVNIGYEQNDAKQVARQIADMHRRGFSVIWIDWYGPSVGHRDEDEVTLKVMHEAERLRQSGIDFSFVVQPDKGTTLKCGADKACNTEKLIAALNYEYKTYESSPAYLRWNGRPVVPFFLFDSNTPADWDEIAAKVPGNPIFVFINTGGFTHPQSGGAFAWNGIKGPSDMGLAYLDNFYKVAATYDPAKEVIVGSAYAGFDDRLASWGKNKIIARQCGLTWLDTMQESLNYEKATGSPLPFLSVMTWNDYEEGTPIEMGIDNCVAGIPAAVKNNHLMWSVAFGKDNLGYTGSEQTIAYFRIFANPSGDKLQELKRVSAEDAHDLDLSPFHLRTGEKIYIQAVGKTQILNHLSDPIPVP